MAPILLVSLLVSSQWWCGSVGWEQFRSSSALDRTVSNAGLPAIIYLTLENLWEQHLWEAPNQLANVFFFFFSDVQNLSSHYLVAVALVFLSVSPEKSLPPLFFAMLLHFQLLLGYPWTATSLWDWPNPTPSHDFQTLPPKLRATWWPFTGSPLPFRSGRFEIGCST